MRALLLFLLSLSPPPAHALCTSQIHTQQWMGAGQTPKDLQLFFFWEGGGGGSEKEERASQSRLSVSLCVCLSLPPCDQICKRGGKKTDLSGRRRKRSSSPSTVRRVPWVRWGGEWGEGVKEGAGRRRRGEKRREKEGGLATERGGRKKAAGGSGKERGTLRTFLALGRRRSKLREEEGLYFLRFRFG